GSALIYSRDVRCRRASVLTALGGEPDERRHSRLRALHPLRQLCHGRLLAHIGCSFDHEQQQMPLRRQSGRPCGSLAVAEELPQGGAELGDADDVLDRQLARPHGPILGRSPERDSTRATSDGASAWASIPTRYQLGTNVSRRSPSRTPMTCRATSAGPITACRRTGFCIKARCGKPSVSTKPGLTVWTRIPRGRSSAVIALEKASCACFEAEYGPDGGNATVPATETTLTTSARRAASSAGSSDRT